MSSDVLDRVLRELRGYIDRSAGAPIELASGTTRVFRQTHSFDAADLDELSRSLGFSLPTEYSDLLTVIGAAECFVDDRTSSSIEIYDPREVAASYRDFFADPSDLQKFFPIASDRRLQEIVVLVVGRPGPRNIFIVSHDMPPEDWPLLIDEGELTSIAAWLDDALSTDGHLRAH